MGMNVSNGKKSSEGTCSVWTFCARYTLESLGNSFYIVNTGFQYKEVDWAKMTIEDLKAKCQCLLQQVCLTC